MGQMYVHRFEVRDGVSKSELDAAWGVAFKAFARSGNWGGVEKGVTHKQSYGTAWGAYVLIEVDDPEGIRSVPGVSPAELRPRRENHL
jgi:hypothetical protein